MLEDTPLFVTLNAKETSMYDKNLENTAYQMHHALRWLINDPCPANWIQAGKALEAYETWIRSKYNSSKEIEV